MAGWHPLSLPASWMEVMGCGHSSDSRDWVGVTEAGS